MSYVGQRIMFRGLDGHFVTVLIFFRRRYLYINIRKYPDLKDKIYGYFLYLTISYT